MFKFIEMVKLYFILTILLRSVPYVPSISAEHPPEADSARPSSDFSSIGPSQSASQVGQHLPEPINLMTVVTNNTDPGMLSQSVDHNTASVPDAVRLSVSSTTHRQTNSVSSTAPSSLYYSPITPTTYKLETVTYAPAVSLVVPGKNSSSPPNGSGGAITPLALGPPLDANSSDLPLAPALVMEESSNGQGLHIKMHIPPAHAINEYDIPTAEAAGSGSGTGTETSTTRRHSRGGSQEGSTWIRHSTHQTSLVTSAPEPTPSGTHANMSSSTSTLHLQRHVLDRRITEEELPGNSSLTDVLEVVGGDQTAVSTRVVTSALIEVFDDPESGNEDSDESSIAAQDQLIKQGKLAVVENPRFASEERKRELEKERRELEKERMKAASVEEGQESGSEQGKEKKKFSFLHKRAETSAATQSPDQSQVDTWSGAFSPAVVATPTAIPSTPTMSPSKAGGNLPDSLPVKVSPSKRFFGSLRGLFGHRQQYSSPLPSSPRQDPSHSPFNSRSPSHILHTLSSDTESETDAPTKTGGGLQALFRGGGGKKKAGSTTSTRWSTRTDKNIRDLSRSADGDNDDRVGNGNTAVQTGLFGPHGGASAGSRGVRQRSASDMGPAPAVARVATGGGKKLRKTQLPPSTAAPAPAPQTPQRNGTTARAHTPTPATPMRTAATGKRSASVDEGVRRVNGVQQEQTPAGGRGKGVVADLGKRRRTTSDSVGPPLSGGATNPPAGAPVRGTPTAARTATAPKVSSDAAPASAVSGHATSPLKKSVVKNVGPGPTVPASMDAPTPATATPSRPTPARKASTGKNQPLTTPNLPVDETKAGDSRQPPAQPQTHHQRSTSHTTSSSGGGAIVLAAGGSHPSGTLVSHPGWDAQALPTPGGGLSRNNSLLSTASAPAGSGGAGGGMSKAKKQRQTALGHGVGSGTNLGRKGSLGSSSGHAGAGGEKKAGTHIASGVSVVPTQPAQSLMSIVEDVAKHNREWSQESSQLLKNKNKILAAGLEKAKVGSVQMVDVVRAPPRIRRDELAPSSPPTVKSWVMETSAMNSAPNGDVTGGALLVDVKAPGSVFDQVNANSGAAAQKVHSNSFPDSMQSRKASGTPTPTASGSRRPAKSPLRSALKNPSRTPSPLPGPFLVPYLQKQQQQQHALEDEHRHSNGSMVAPVPVSTQSPTFLGPAVSGQLSQNATNNKSDTRSTMSNGRPASFDSTSQYGNGKSKNRAAISEETLGDSTSTGNEMFYTDDEGNQSDHEMAHDASPMVNGHAVGYTGSSELSHSTTSTTVVHHSTTVSSTSQSSTQVPRRRKSVRVSLQPTFSPSPPAIEDDSDEPWVWKQEPATEGRQHVHAPVPVAAPSLLLNPRMEQSAYGHDIWEDSSDEAAEYQKAKRLLTRAARKEKDITFGTRS